MNGGVWIVSYVLLWVTVVFLGLIVVVLLRQIGLLHTRIAPMGVNFAGEGPELDQPAPPLPEVDYRRSDVTVVAFISPTCELCAALVPGLERIEASYDEVSLETISSEDGQRIFGAFAVRSTPYLVAVDREGVVRSRGVANSVDQAEEMLAEVLAGPPVVPGAAVIDLDLLEAESAETFPRATPSQTTPPRTTSSGRARTGKRA